MLLRSLAFIHRIVGPARAARRLATAATVDGVVFKGMAYPYRWLRDSCQCPDCVHPSTRQKLHRTTDIGQDVHPEVDGVKHTQDGMEITWLSGHRSSFSATFLEAHASPSDLHRFHRDVEPSRWNRERILDAKSLFVQYTDLQQPASLLSAIDQLVRYGLLFVTGVSNKETSNETCEARKLAEIFGEIRTTFYGQLWDVISVRNSTNIAYTNLDLGLHMDLLYFQHPPRLQLLHCLRNRVLGGTSVFVDALDAAERLRHLHPVEFKALTTSPVFYHYINAGNHLHHSHPVIELDEQYSGDSVTAPIKFINYSPPFQAPLSPSTPEEFYVAFDRFTSYLDDPTAQYAYTLREGDAVLFDNRRVLHSRTAFTDPSEDKEGATTEETTNRWLKGCYLEIDTPLSRGRVLKEKLATL